MEYYIIYFFFTFIVRVVYCCFNLWSTLVNLSCFKCAIYKQNWQIDWLIDWILFYIRFIFSYYEFCNEWNVSDLLMTRISVTSIISKVSHLLKWNVNIECNLGCGTEFSTNLSQHESAFQSHMHQVHLSLIRGGCVSGSEDIDHLPAFNRWHAEVSPSLPDQRIPSCY